MCVRLLFHSETFDDSNNNFICINWNISHSDGDFVLLMLSMYDFISSNSIFSNKIGNNEK